jgi:putative tryptophan/tyrosine transport system substrate-binding protein
MIAAMERRAFITLLGGTAMWPLAAGAQQSPSRPLIGVISPLSSDGAARNINAFRSGLRDLGYEEGRNIMIEFRYAEGVVARLPDLATELVARKPAVIVAGSVPAAMAAHNATRAIPLVVSVSEDPVALGLAASLARPGGNVTGFSIEGDETLNGKRLQLLKDAVPTLSRVGIILNPDDAGDAAKLKTFPSAARALSVTISVLEVRSPADLDNAFAVALNEGLHGLYVSESPWFNSRRVEIVGMAARSRLPAVYGFREFTVAGGLMSFATSLPDVYRRKAGLVDKILKGESASDLPFERPTKFELVVNLKTAKALGLTISEPFLLTADEVIE